MYGDYRTVHIFENIELVFTKLDKAELFLLKMIFKTGCESCYQKIRKFSFALSFFGISTMK